MGGGSESVVLPLLRLGLMIKYEFSDADLWQISWFAMNFSRNATKFVKDFSGVLFFMLCVVKLFVGVNDLLRFLLMIRNYIVMFMTTCTLFDSVAENDFLRKWLGREMFFAMCLQLQLGVSWQERSKSCVHFLLNCVMSIVVLLLARWTVWTTASTDTGTATTALRGASRR